MLVIPGRRASSLSKSQYLGLRYRICRWDVNVLISPWNHGVGLEAGILLSQTGCCHAFDKSADGMVRGEGWSYRAAALSDARLEGRRILAILTGSAANQDEVQRYYGAKLSVRKLRSCMQRALASIRWKSAFTSRPTGPPLG